MEPQVRTIDDFRLTIENLRNSSSFIDEKTERTPVKLKQKHWFNWAGRYPKSSIFNFQFASSSFRKHLIILEVFYR
jgi:hypothetical protein